MKTLAPELSALMTIFASAGPVSSTRRSSRSEGAVATVHSASRSSRVSAGNSGRSPAAKRASRSSRAASRSRRRAPKRRWSAATRSSASRSSSSSWPGTACAATSALMPPSASASNAAAAARQERRAVRREHALDRLLREAPQRARQAGPAVPGALGGRAAVPAGRTHAQTLGVFALERVSADHDVADHECAELGEGIGRLSDRIAEGDRARAVGHDAVVGTVAGDHGIGPAPVPVDGHDHVDRAAVTLDIAIERAPQTGGVRGVGGDDRVDEQQGARQLAVDAADLLDPAGRRRRLGIPLGVRSGPAPQSALDLLHLQAPRTAANRPRRPVSSARAARR